MIRNLSSIAKYAFADFNAAKDYYKTLGLPSTAGKAEIKKAFHSLAKKYHPDSNDGKEVMFKEVNEAYQVLSSERTKKDYDDARKSNTTSGQAQQQQHPYSRSGTHSSSHQSSQRNTYRGYQNQQGGDWSDPSVREKIMQDLFRAQQSQAQRFYSNEGSTKQDFE